MDIEYINRPTDHHRSTTRYSQLPNNEDISRSNIDIDRESPRERWNYGLGFSKPVGQAPKKYTNHVSVSYDQYIMPHEIYKLPNDHVVKKYLEADFNPPIITPEDSKFSSDPKSIKGR